MSTGTSLTTSTKSAVPLEITNIWMDKQGYLLLLIKLIFTLLIGLFLLSVEKAAMEKKIRLIKIKIKNSFAF
jgi:hypothetical protein